MTEPNVNEPNGPVTNVIQIVIAERGRLWDQAVQEITVEEAGSVVYVKVLGHEVARFSTWASLVNHAETKPEPVLDVSRAAEIYANTLRKAFVTTHLAEILTQRLKDSVIR